MSDQDALDAYSAAVVRIAETMLPSVAAVSVRSARGSGAGSASVISEAGHLLTSAHVVAGATRAEDLATVRLDAPLGTVLPALVGALRC